MERELIQYTPGLVLVAYLLLVLLVLHRGFWVRMIMCVFIPIGIAAWFRLWLVGAVGPTFTADEIFPWLFPMVVSGYTAIALIAGWGSKPRQWWWRRRNIEYIDC